MSDGQRCPNCNALNAPGAAWCNQCFASFRAPPPPPLEKEPEMASAATAHFATTPPPGPASGLIGGGGIFGVGTDRATWKCASCGTDNTIELDLCKSCGTSFSAALQARKPKVKKKRRIHSALIAAAAETTDDAFDGLRGLAKRVLRAVLTVLSGTPALWIFPFLGLLAVVGIAFTYGHTLLVLGLTESSETGTALPDFSKFANDLAQGLFRLVALTMVMFYLCYFVGQLVKAAVVAMAMPKLGGFRPRISEGFAVVFRLAPLLMWTSVGGTVALFLGAAERMKRSRGDLTGFAFMNVAGVAWNAVTIMVVPVIVLEPHETHFVKRSARLFKEKWGEAALGETGIWAICTVIGCAMVVILRFVNEQNPMLATYLFSFGIGLLAVISGTLSGVLGAALYRFATTDVAPGPFRTSDIATALRGPGIPTGTMKP